MVLPPAACSLGWSPGLGALSSLPLKNTHTEALGLEPVLTSQGRLSWRQGKGSKWPPTPGEETALEKDPVVGKRWQVQARKTWAAPPLSAPAYQPSRVKLSLAIRFNN